MSLDLYLSDTRDLDAVMQAAPGTDIAPSFSQAFMAAWREARDFDQSLAYDRARAQAVQEALDRFQDATGEALPNPMAGGFSDEPLGMQPAALVAVRKRMAEARGIDLGPAPQFPSDEELDARALQIMGAARQQAQAMRARPQTFTSGAADILGGVAGAITDPINIASLAFGATGPATSVARVALTEGAIGLASQGAIEALTFDVKTRAAPDFTAQEALTNVALAGAGGAVIGGGVAALAAGLRSLQARRALTLEERDALNVLEREAATEASNPVPDGGAIPEAVHRSAIAKAEADIDAGRPVDVGTVTREIAEDLTPPPVRMDMDAPEVLAAARAEMPEPFARLDEAQARIAALDADIEAQTRAAAAYGPADALEATDPVTAARLREIQAELAGPIPAARRERLRREAETILETVAEEVATAINSFRIGAMRRIRSTEASRKAARREARRIRQELAPAIDAARQRLGVRPADDAAVPAPAPVRADEAATMAEPPPAVPARAPAAALDGVSVPPPPAPTAPISAARTADEIVADAGTDMDDATIQEANRIMRAMPDMDVPSAVTIDQATQRPGVAMARADDVMSEADQEIAEAQALAACAIGLAE